MEGGSARMKEGGLLLLATKYGGRVLLGELRLACRRGVDAMSDRTLIPPVYDLRGDGVRVA